MRVLITENCHYILVQKFESAGLSCDYKEDISEKEVKEIIPEYDGLIVRSKFRIDKDFLDHSGNLKFIGRIGAGLENIDIGYALQHGIKCFNSPEGNRDAVGEHAAGMLLALFNKLTCADIQVKSGVWDREKNRGLELKGKTIGIIGYGNTGRAFAKKLSGFEMNVISFDKYKTDYSDEYSIESDMNELHEKSDILSLHVPLTSETRYMINDDFIEKFKKSFFLINTSRGKIANTGSIVKFLKSGKILGTGLDVLEYENLSFEDLIINKHDESFNYLVHSDNVILSPHVAGWTVESYYKMSAFLADKIINDLKINNMSYE